MNKTFIQFLTEVNIGSYESDKRVFDLKKLLVYDMISNITNDVYSNTIKDVDLNSRTINLSWSIGIGFDTDYHSYIDNGAKFTYEKVNDKETFLIILSVIRERGLKDDDFKNKLLKYINTSAEGNLIHEIKHMLDFIDEKLKPEHIDSVPKIYAHSTDKEISKYISHDVEKEPWLFSVVSQLKQIKQNIPTISYQDAIELSDDYQNYIKHLRPSLRNKYKNKIIHFWYSNYEQEPRFNLKKMLNSISK